MAARKALSIDRLNSIRFPGVTALKYSTGVAPDWIEINRQGYAASM